MLTESEVQAALSQVVHPTYGMTLNALQMVRAIRLSPDRIEVDLVMNCPGCPAGEATLLKAQHALQALFPSGAGQVIIRLLPQVWHPPWESAAQEFL
jgi:metal-sulfur cluster biosynthetic enzyme